MAAMTSIMPRARHTCLPPARAAALAVRLAASARRHRAQ